MQIHVVLTARDAFGNAAVQAAGASFALSLSSGAAGDTRSPLSGGLAAVPRGLGAGLAYAGFRLPAPGAFRLTAALGGDATSGSPFTLQSGELGVASPPHMRAVGTALPFRSSVGQGAGGLGLVGAGDGVGLWSTTEGVGDESTLCSGVIVV